ncbi:hypothetical protein PAPHI01_0522 [Pancytospora philotis]|nr:hypothetical protein PAPHI01_0522 [Pancytospora philotis]
MSTVYFCMEGEMDEKAVHSSVVGLTQAAAAVNKKIHAQALVVESIKSESRIGMEKFMNSTRVFSAAIESMENDRRNMLIIFLLLVVLLLVYYLRLN